MYMHARYPTRCLRKTWRISRALPVHPQTCTTRGAQNAINKGHHGRFHSLQAIHHQTHTQLLHVLFIQPECMRSKHLHKNVDQVGKNITFSHHSYIFTSPVQSRNSSPFSYSLKSVLHPSSENAERISHIVHPRSSRLIPIITYWIS